MNEATFSLWVLMVILGIADFFLRLKFNLVYLHLSIPLFSKPMAAGVYLKDLGANKVCELESTKYYLDSPKMLLWLQCKFANNRSTLGLLKKYELGQGDMAVVREQTRLSVGAVLIIAVISVFVYLQNQRFVGTGSQLQWLQYFPILMVVAGGVNYFLSYRRLNREAAESIGKLRRS